jgi:hypothetical protein
MTTYPPIVGQAENIVTQFVTHLTEVREAECLCCYVWRQLDAFPCDGTHRHALRFQASTAPRATALLERLRRAGACCCDCELFMNGYHPHQRFWTPQRDVEVDGQYVVIHAQPPDELPCAGVRRGSLQPCDNWEPLRRW